MSDKAHSKVGASVIERVSECPGSMKLVGQCPPAPASKYADEGTAAHALASDYLQAVHDGLNPPDIENRIGEYIKVESGAEIEVTAEMVAAVEVYIEHCMTIVTENNLSPHFWGVEARIRIPGDESHEEMFGTCDFWAYVPYTALYITDYKHGAGKRVPVTGNKQTDYYALGKLLEFDEDERAAIKHIWKTIVQPRCPGGGVDSYAVTPTYIMLFWDELKGIVERAHADHPPLVAGDHCGNTFCPAAAYCPAVRDAQDNRAEKVFNELILRSNQQYDITQWTADKLAAALDIIPLVEARIKAIEDLALARAQAGEEIPGRKLVTAEGRTTWADMKAANELLAATGLPVTAYLNQPKLRTPSQVAAAIKKAKAEFDVWPLTYTPVRGVKLVSEFAKGELKTPFEGVTIDV